MAVNSSTKKLAEQSVDIDMTPMIDITFLLLIFFMCTLNLQPLEGLLLSNLPTNVGVFATPTQKDPLPEVRLMLRRVEPPSGSYVPEEIILVCDTEQYIGADKYNMLYKYLEKIVARSAKVDVLIMTDTSDPLTSLYDVPHGEIISTLDVCHAINNKKEYKDKLNMKFHLTRRFDFGKKQ